MVPAGSEFKEVDESGDVGRRSGASPTSSTLAVGVERTSTKHPGGRSTLQLPWRARTTCQLPASSLRRSSCHV